MVIAKFTRDTMAEASKQFRRRIEAVVEAIYQKNLLYMHQCTFSVNLA
jgi:hypothetical protein